MSKPFPWRAGMRSLSGLTVLLATASEVVRWVDRAGVVYDFRAQLWALDEQPDPNDGATKGALLEVVRELWGAPMSFVDWSPEDGWLCWIRTSETIASWSGATEFAALEAARVAAP